jgi:hypothetical protein
MVLAGMVRSIHNFCALVAEHASVYGVSQAEKHQDDVEGEEGL